MGASRPTKPTPRVAVLFFVGAVALACSARPAPNETVSSSTPTRSLAGPAQDTAPTHFEPKGARPARLVNSAVPLYPATLARARVEGEVLVVLVVDTSGLVMPGSLKVLRSTDRLLTEAVHSAVSGMRFAPATLNGRAVRQLIQQPFFFDVRGSAASAARKPMPASTPTSDSTNRNPMRLRPIVSTVP